MPTYCETCEEEGVSLKLLRDIGYTCEACEERRFDESITWR